MCIKISKPRAYIRDFIVRVKNMKCMQKGRYRFQGQKGQFSFTFQKLGLFCIANIDEKKDLCFHGFAARVESFVLCNGILYNFLLH